MKKRTIAIILTLAFLLTALTFSLMSVFSATYYQDGDWKYEKEKADSQEYSINAYLGTSEMIRIPSLFQNKPVTKISNNTFINRTDISYIEIPATITSIGQSAFYGCSNLGSIEIPSSVTEIGLYAFYGCSSMSSVVFSSDTQLKVIPAHCFNGCASLSEVTIADGITTISARAFLNCTGLTNVTIYPSVTSIGERAFSGCENLTISGWTNTYAHTYASENNIPFVSLGEYVPASTTLATEPTTVQSSSIETKPASPSSTPNSSVEASKPTVPTTAPSSTQTSSIQVTSSVPTEVKVSYLIGDADLSGIINIKDATLIQKYSADLVTFDRTQLFLANCDGTGGVNVKDATQIQKYCAGYKNILFVGDEVYF